jgi:trans-2,3-dihydro-3-hydroxyanthranilate isomerase
LAEYPFTLVDVFAAAPLQGNLLPVIHDADAVSTETMQHIAARFRQSETSFLQSAPEPHQTYRHRIFTVEQELPFAGHPSIGSAAAWTRRRGLPESDVVQLTPSGEQRLHVKLDGAVAVVDLWQNPAVFGGEGSSDKAMRALGLPADARHPSLTPQIVSTGLPTLLVLLADADLLRQITVDWDALDEARAIPGGDIPLGVYVAGPVASGHWRTRLFARDIPGGEDAATGSAAGPLGAYLKHYTGQTSLVIDQGVEMGSPSRILVRTDDGIVVSGEVQFLAEGTISIA